MIAAHVSRLNGCEFCVGIHYDTLRSMGAADTVIDQLERGDLTDYVPCIDSTLRFAEHLTRIRRVFQVTTFNRCIKTAGPNKQLRTLQTSSPCLLRSIDLSMPSDSSVMLRTSRTSPQCYLETDISNWHVRCDDNSSHEFFELVSAYAAIDAFVRCNGLAVVQISS